MALVDRVRFDASFSFIYSPKPGTPASELIDEVPLEEKNPPRSTAARLKHHADEIAESMVGQRWNYLLKGCLKRTNDALWSYWKQSYR